MGQRHAAFRHFPQAVPSTFAIKKFDRAPCVRACPANLSAQGYVQLIKAGKYNESLQLIMERLPLPGTIGRICPHPCESDCRRQEVDEPVAICSLKRFAADQADWDALPVPEVPQKNQAVAIVGAGPAGLSCAYHLALKGYRTVIFEAAPEAGGWLRYGIPEYRLPREVLQREVDYLKRLGVEIRYNSPIGAGRTIDDLLTRDGFAAVFLGVGTQDSIRLPVPGAEAAGVLWGVEYLKEVNSTGESPTQGKRVAVIGGGNVAMDVARVARRQGAASVTLIALESPEELPASPWEVEEAKAEGIEILHRLGVKQILSQDGQVTGLELKAVARVFDEAGPLRPGVFRRPPHHPGGRRGHHGHRPEGRFEVHHRGRRHQSHPRGLIEADPDTLATSRAGVFAGGDVVTGPWIAIGAVAAGREAAISIDRYLDGLDLKADREAPLRPIQDGNWNPIPSDQPKTAREPMPELPQAEWTKGFKELNLGFTEAQAQAEAARCINCGACSECMQCVEACKAGAIAHEQQPRTQTLEVGAVILAPGFKTFDAKLKPEYGYGRYPNVITSLEFERLLSATGPCAGHVRRPSDQADPKKSPGFSAWAPGTPPSAGNTAPTCAACTPPSSPSSPKSTTTGFRPPSFSSTSGPRARVLTATTSGPGTNTGCASSAP